MSYFDRLRRPLIIVSPELFPLNEAIEVRPRHPGRICAAQGSRVKAEALGINSAEVEPPCGRERSKSPQAKSRAQPRDRERSEGPALSEAQGSRSRSARPRRGSPRRPRPRKLARPVPSGAEGREAIGSARPDPGRHQRKCGVCRHPDRDAIEEAFIHWHSPTLIAQDYEISDDSLYRHAYATGLDAVRSRNLRCALERILEKAQRVIPTADSIVRAARAYTRINHAGEWVEPPTHVIVSSGSAFHLGESRAATDHSSIVPDRPSRPPSNRGIPELENGSTR